MTLKGRGMPFFKRDNTRGDLHITFNVIYPLIEDLDDETIENLQTVIKKKLINLGTPRTKNWTSW